MDTDPTDGTPPAQPTPPAPPPPVQAAPAAQPAAPTISAEDRKALLNQRVQVLVGKGYRVESQTDVQVVVVNGHRPNHLLHLILTIITAGLWGLFVWLPLSIFGGEKRRAVMINEAGQPYEIKA